MSNLEERVNGNMNNLSVRQEVSSNNDITNARFESLSEKIASKAASRSNSRAVSPAKVKVEPIDLVFETPRAQAPAEDISMTATLCLTSVSRWSLSA